MSDPQCKPASPEFTIEARLRKLITEQNILTDTYKTALGTIVEQRSCIEDWQRRSQQWCSKCDKASALAECERKCQELIMRLSDQRAETAKAKAEQACESDGETLAGRRDEMTCEERCTMLRNEIIAWIEAGAAGTKLINEQHQRLRTIRALANARLADTAHMASIQEAETLWAIVAATEGA